MAEGGEGDCLNFEQHELLVWDHNATAGCGVCVAAVMERSWDDDEEAAEDGCAAGGPPSKSVQVDDVGGEGGSRKGKGKGKADRGCLLCGQKGPFHGAWPQQVVRAEDPVELLVEHLAVPEGSRQRPGRWRSKGKDQFFYKG